MRKLNDDQLEILKHLYYFRFATSTLLAERLKPKYRESINSRLNILLRHKLIGKHYDKSYKLNGKPAVYFLLPESFKWLLQEEDVSKSMLKRIYNDRKAQDSFIGHCLNIFVVSNKLVNTYGDKLDFFTQSELIEGYDHFPKPLPDGFIKYGKSSRSQPKSFFIHLVSHSKPFFTTSRKLDSYIAYAKFDKWDRNADKLPNVLFVCDDPALENRLQKQSNRIHDEKPSYLDFYTTTLERLDNMDNLVDDIWLKIQDNPARRESLLDT